MTQYVGLDVADEETSVCVVDQEGAVLVEAKVASEPAAIAAFIRAQAPQVVKVGFETGPLAAWHWHELKQLGLPVVCLDARHAKAALACQINKTDRNDAFGLAQLVRMGWYREVQVKSYGSHYVRAALRVRALLVRSRCDFENQVRGLLKIFGLRLGKTGRKGFAKRMAELLEKQPELEALVAALLKVRETIVEQIATLDAGLQRIAKGSATIRRLMTVPGIGPITALAFASAIDNPFRFRKASSVGAYFGLTPRRYQSGEIDRPGRVSKAGDGMVRRCLFEAAVVLLRRVNGWSPLKAWAVRLSKRIGWPRAVVALARKLTVILHCIWVDGTEFWWTRTEAKA
jgi:transposase